MKLEMIIWVHSHTDKPGVPASFEIFSVSGDEIPTDLLDDLREQSNADMTEELFGDFETEQEYRVTLSYDFYEDHYESFVVASEKLEDARIDVQEGD